MLSSFLQTVPKKTLWRVQTLDLNIESKTCHHEVNSLLQRTVLMGGKRLRPLLTYLMGNLFNVDSERLTPYAKSIEMVHAASLSHDDVIDNATTRRGKPSINKVGSNKKAVLAGDYLLADVIVSLTNEGHLDLVREMSCVIQDLAEGEWIQLDASEERQYSRELIEKIAAKKTASVMSWCCIAPAYLAKQSHAVIEYARQFGHNLGIAFQLMDDTLDFSGNSKKDNMLDLQNGIVNAVVFEWLELNPEYKEKFKNGENIKSLLDQNKLDEAIEIVKNRALKHLDQCHELLEILIREAGLNQDRAKEAKRPLELILQYLAERKF